MKEAQVPPKRRFLQEPHGVTTQKTPFFIVTAVKTSNGMYLASGIIKDTTFRKLDLDPISETLCLLIRRIPDDG
jgi:hypothetical protein